MLSAQMKQFSIIEPDYFLPILRDLAGAKPIPQVSARQLASITAFLRSPSTILIDMACLRTIRTSDSSTDHEFLVGSIEVRLMYGIATSRSVKKSQPRSKVHKDVVLYIDCLYEAQFLRSTCLGELAHLGARAFY